MPIHHELLSRSDLYGHDMTWHLGSECDFARHAEGAVLSHKDTSAPSDTFENSKQTSAASHLSMCCHLDRRRHPRELSALRKYAFVGIELYFEHRHGGALKFRLHGKTSLMVQCTCKGGN